MAEAAVTHGEPQQTGARSAHMTKHLKKGDHVSWKSHAGTAHGKVVRRVTEPMEIKGHHVAASMDNPEFLVETAEGKRAAHKASALRKA
ncbi:MAG: DUF2945 domain-containing protein [Novosphingobium sp.]